MLTIIASLIQQVSVVGQLAKLQLRLGALTTQVHVAPPRGRTKKMRIGLLRFDFFSVHLYAYATCQYINGFVLRPLITTSGGCKARNEGAYPKSF